MRSVLRCSTTKPTFFPSSERKKRKNCVSDFALPDDSTTDFFPLCYSHHTHTIRSHYVIRAEILRPRPMILWRDCALFACDCINDTCKKKKKKTLASRSRTFLLPGRCVSNIVTGMVADLYFISYTKKKKKLFEKIVCHPSPVYHAARLVYPRVFPPFLFFYSLFLK